MGSITPDAKGDVKIKSAGSVSIEGKTIEITAEELVDVNGSRIDLN